jgi:hypothetical protein
MDIAPLPERNGHIAQYNDLCRQIRQLLEPGGPEALSRRQSRELWELREQAHRAIAKALGGRVFSSPPDIERIGGARRPYSIACDGLVDHARLILGPVRAVVTHTYVRRERIASLAEQLNVRPLLLPATCWAPQLGDRCTGLVLVSKDTQL